MQETSKCKLCLIEKPLQKRSHIIPDFMYQPLFDEKHKMELFSPSNMLKGKNIIDRPSTGEYEGGILCKQCDNETLSQYETYAQQIFNRSEGREFSNTKCQTFRNEDKVVYTKCVNVDYKKFKLFLLSILWRASISSRPFFGEVKLGPYEEEIRKMLIDGDPKETNNFPILLFTSLNDRSFPSEIIGPPWKSRFENQIRYVFTISGVIYLFQVSPGSIAKGFDSFVLSPNNDLYMFHLPEGKSKEIFLRSFGVIK